MRYVFVLVLIFASLFVVTTKLTLPTTSNSTPLSSLKEEPLQQQRNVVQKSVSATIATMTAPSERLRQQQPTTALPPSLPLGNNNDNNNRSKMTLEDVKRFLFSTPPRSLAPFEFLLRPAPWSGSPPLSPPPVASTTWPFRGGVLSSNLALQTGAMFRYRVATLLSDPEQKRLIMSASKRPPEFSRELRAELRRLGEAWIHDSSNSVPFPARSETDFLFSRVSLESYGDSNLRALFEQITRLSGQAVIDNHNQAFKSLVNMTFRGPVWSQPQPILIKEQDKTLRLPSSLEALKRAATSWESRHSVREAVSSLPRMSQIMFRFDYNRGDLFDATAGTSEILRKPQAIVDHEKRAAAAKAAAAAARDTIAADIDASARAAASARQRLPPQLKSSVQSTQSLESVIAARLPVQPHVTPAAFCSAFTREAADWVAAGKPFSRRVLEDALYWNTLTGESEPLQPRIILLGIGVHFTEAAFGLAQETHEVRGRSQQNRLNKFASYFLRSCLEHAKRNPLAVVIVENMGADARGAMMATKVNWWVSVSRAGVISSVLRTRQIHRIVRKIRCKLLLRRRQQRNPQRQEAAGEESTIAAENNCVPKSFKILDGPEDELQSLKRTAEAVQNYVNQVLLTIPRNASVPLLQLSQEELVDVESGLFDREVDIAVEQALAEYSSSSSSKEMSQLAELFEKSFLFHPLDLNAVKACADQNLRVCAFTRDGIHLKKRELKKQVGGLMRFLIKLERGSRS